jgi:hypothetical protein
MTPIIPALFPSNDLAFTVRLYTTDATTGRRTPLLTGTVTAFLATSSAPTATAADPSLSVAVTHLAAEKWLVQFDATVLTPTLLATLFASATPYLIIVQAGGIRTVAELVYTPVRLATVS